MIKEYFGHTIDLTEIAAVSKPELVLPSDEYITFSAHLKGGSYLLCKITTIPEELYIYGCDCLVLRKKDGYPTIEYGPECLIYERVQPMIDELINDWKEATKLKEPIIDDLVKRHFTDAELGSPINKVKVSYEPEQEHD